MGGEDTGLFGPDSITWTVHVEQVLWIAGMRALFLQSLNPRVFRATQQNSALFDRKRAWKRFIRTAEFVTVRTYGTSEQVERASSRVRAIHAGLTGYDPDTDETFRLDEPESLLWVHCAEIDSYADVAHRAGILPSGAEVDRYIAENRRAAEVVGIPFADAPASRAELKDYFDSMRPRLYACAEARRSLVRSFYPPVPAKLTPLRLVVPSINLVALGSLPGWARRMYGSPVALPTTDLVITAQLRAIREATRLARRTSTEELVEQVRAQAAEITP